MNKFMQTPGSHNDYASTAHRMFREPVSTEKVKGPDNAHNVDTIDGLGCCPWPRPAPLIRRCQGGGARRRRGGRRGWRPVGRAARRWGMRDAIHGVGSGVAPTPWRRRSACACRASHDGERILERASQTSFPPRTAEETSGALCSRTRTAAARTCTPVRFSRFTRCGGARALARAVRGPREPRRDRRRDRCGCCGARPICAWHPPRYGREPLPLLMCVCGGPAGRRRPCTQILNPK